VCLPLPSAAPPALGAGRPQASEPTPADRLRWRFMSRWLVGHHQSGVGVLHGYCNAWQSAGVR